MEGYNALTQQYRARFQALVACLESLEEWDRDEIGAFLFLLQDVFFEEFEGFTAFRDWQDEKALYIRDMERMADYRERDDDPNQALAYRLFLLSRQAMELDNPALIAEFGACLERFIEPSRESGRCMAMSQRYSEEYSCPHINDDAVHYIAPWANGKGGFQENPAMKFVGEGNIAALAMASNQLLWVLCQEPEEIKEEFRRDFDHLVSELSDCDAEQRRHFGMQLFLVVDFFLRDFGSLKAFSKFNATSREIYISALGHARKLMAKQDNALGGLAFELFRLLLCALHVEDAGLLLRCAASVDDFLDNDAGYWGEDARAALGGG